MLNTRPPIVVVAAAAVFALALGIAQGPDILRALDAHARPDPRPHAMASPPADSGGDADTDATPAPDPQPAPPERPVREFRRWSHAPLVESLDPDDAGSRAAGRVLERLVDIRESVRKTWYRHKTRVHQRKGIYAWDCSGMTTWILEREAPRAREALRRDRPVAITYLETIMKAPTDRARRGWQQIADIQEVRPGDIFAWRRPKEWGKGATGHVGFVVSRPQPLDDVEDAYVIRIVDSTRYPHDHDTRSGEQTGFGFGNLLFVTDEHGKPTAYGWFGARSRSVVPTDVAFGRVSR